MPMTPKEFELLQEVRDAVVKMAADCKPCQASLARHDKIIAGNGWLGLHGKVTILWWIVILAGGAVFLQQVSAMAERVIGN